MLPVPKRSIGNTLRNWDTNWHAIATINLPWNMKFNTALWHKHLPSRCLASLDKYVWELSKKCLLPIINDNLPVPLALVEKISFGCNKEWLSNICNCFKKNLLYIDLCKFSSNEHNTNGEKIQMIYVKSDDNE